jgi:hypothetical protein
MKTNIKISGKVRPILRDGKTGKIKWVGEWNHNLIPNVGLTAIARRLGNIELKTNEGAITYAAVGGGVTTPQSTDEFMEDEIDRKQITIHSVVGQTLFLEIYFTEGEATGSITKFALFGEEATEVVDTGTMMEYADFDTPFTKAINEALTVEIQITVS